jgi:allantoicase
VLGFDIDTNHFLGNHPPFASVDGALASPGAALEDLTFRPLLAPSPLRPGSQNLFAAPPGEPVSHVRLNIFPDGGVARFRVYGSVMPDFSRREVDAETGPQLEPAWVDLAAVKSGGRALACSDAFFGPMNNLLLPGRAANMGGGWETRRRRGEGHDFLWIALGARGIPRLVEVDTNHFKGNYPDRCSLDAVDHAEVSIPELMFGAPEVAALLPEQKLSAHTRHFFRVEEAAARPFTHVRLNIFPDGGVSRLRIWGTPHA